MFKNKSLLLVVIIAIMVSWGSFQRFALVEKVERWLLDVRMPLAHARMDDPEIVLVLAGEETMARIGEWPWPRRYHAQVLDRLRMAKAVVMDILFPESSNPKDDELLAESVSRLDNVIVSIHLAPAQGETPPRIIYPYDALFHAAKSVGVTNIEQDIDGIFRYAIPLWPVGGEVAPSLALSAYSLAEGEDIRAEENDGRVILKLKNGDIGLDEKGGFWVFFTKKPYKTYEYIKVLLGETPPDEFAGKIVVLGIAASGANDFYVTPMSRVISGAQFNAEAIGTLMAGKGVIRLPDYFDAFISGMMAFICALVVFLMRPRTSWIIFLFAEIAYAVIALLAFKLSLIWIAMASPLIGGAVSYSGSLYLNLKVIHRDWEVKSLSVESLYALMNPGAMLEGDFAGYLKRIWPGIKRDTGISLLSVGVSLEEAVSEIKKFGGDSRDGGELILLKGRVEKPRYRLLLPVPAMREQGQKYAYLGWDSDLPEEEIKSIAVMVLSSAWFFSALKEAKERKKMLFDAINAMVMAIDAKDPITSGHSERVAALSMEIANHMGFDDRTVEDIYLGAIIHDVGKIGIPDSILLKEGKLTAEEYDRIKSHTLMGEMIMDAVRLPEAAVKGMAEHHERWNAKGYPRGIEGEAISMAGRIVALADVADALQSERPYKPGMKIEEVCGYLHSRMGVDFDPNVVRVFLEIKAPDGWSVSEKVGAK